MLFIRQHKMLFGGEHPNITIDEVPKSITLHVAETHAGLQRLEANLK